MRAILFVFLILSVNIAFTQESKCDKKIVENAESIGILEACFAPDEMIEIYKKDTAIVKRIFNEAIFDRTIYTKYCYIVCVNFFKNQLIEKQNSSNNETVGRMLMDLDNIVEMEKPEIGWEKVFKTCQTCPFGEYPDEGFFYFKFSVIFMGEQEIKEMINYSNGEQWKYALMAIKGGDSFILKEQENYVRYIIDRRIASYIIERWKDSEISQVQDLIATYKSVM